MARSAVSSVRHQWILAVVGTIGLAGSLMTAQLILTQCGWRADFTPDKRYQLSDYSRGLLRDLRDDVQVMAFLRSGDPRNGDIEDLLKRVSLVAPRVRYRLVDINRNPALAREYGIDTYAAVVVESQTRRREFSNPTEELLIAAIVQVTRPSDRRVYFITAHGERNLSAADDRQGFSSARAALMSERYKVGDIGLLTESGIPADAAVLIIAGPSSDFLTGEMLRLDAYLKNGGGALVLLDPGNAPGLVALLRRYGVIVSREVVLDSENRLFAGDFLTMLVPGHSLEHPISSILQSPALMSQVRTVAFEPSDAALSGTVLLETAKESWSTPDLGVLRTGSSDFVAGRDTRGPVPVGVSVLVRSNGPIPGRLVVFGDADFASNSLLGYLGNRDLLLNSVHWLAGEQTLIGARRPKETPGVNQFFVSARQGRIAFWLGTVVQPLIVLLIGAAVLIRRRLSS